MRYEAYILNKNPREDSTIHRNLNRVGTWVFSKDSVRNLDDFMKDILCSVYNNNITDGSNIIVYATNYIKLNLNNDVDDGEVTVSYRHPVYVGTVSDYKPINNLLNDISSISIV